MNRSTRQHFGGTLLVVGLALVSASRPAQAEIVLTVTDPTILGVFAATNSTAAFAPATNNPARAVVNGARASLRQLGSQLIVSSNLYGYAGDQFIASTGFGSSPTHGNLDAIWVQIVGTAGEADGTPVSITLKSGYTGSGNVIITLLANDANYPLNASSVINGLEVGDTFNFWSGLNGFDAVNATLTTTLTVSPLGAAPVPEPSSLALLCALGVMGTGLLYRQRRR